LHLTFRAAVFFLHPEKNDISIWMRLYKKPLSMLSGRCRSVALHFEFRKMFYGWHGLSIESMRELAVQAGEVCAVDMLGCGDGSVQGTRIERSQRKLDHDHVAVRFEQVGGGRSWQPPRSAHGE